MKIFQLKIIYIFHARKLLPLQSNFLAHKRYFLEREILIERQKGVDEIKLYFLDFNTCKLNKLIFVLETFI